MLDYSPGSEDAEDSRDKLSVEKFLDAPERDGEGSANSLFSCSMDGGAK